MQFYSGTLILTILQAQDLQISSEKQQVFVSISIGAITLHTSPIIAKTREWNQELKFHLGGVITTATFRVMVPDTTSETCIGEIHVPLVDLISHNQQQRWYSLVDPEDLNKSTGLLQVGVNADSVTVSNSNILSPPTFPITPTDGPSQPRSLSAPYVPATHYINQPTIYQIPSQSSSSATTTNQYPAQIYQQQAPPLQYVNVQSPPTVIYQQPPSVVYQTPPPPQTTVVYTQPQPSPVVYHDDGLGVGTGLIAGTALGMAMRPRWGWGHGGGWGHHGGYRWGHGGWGHGRC